MALSKWHLSYAVIVLAKISFDTLFTGFKKDGLLILVISYFFKNYIAINNRCILML